MATLQNRLPQIAAGLRPKVAAAVKVGAQRIAETAKERVPVDDGDLQRAIHVERVGPAEYSVVAGDENVFYGHLVEHGTVRTPPRPFLVPAKEARTAEAVALVSAALKRL